MDRVDAITISMKEIVCFIGNVTALIGGALLCITVWHFFAPILFPLAIAGTVMATIPLD
jgi:hypothetical protein